MSFDSAHPCANAQGRIPRRCEEIPPLFVPCLDISVPVASVVVFPLNKLFCCLERVGTFMWSSFGFTSCLLRSCVGSRNRPLAIRQIYIVVFSHVLDSCETVVTVDTVAHSAVARARVGGIVHWSLFIVEHDNHFQCTLSDWRDHRRKTCDPSS